jgi:hypothetical protein
MFLNRKIGKSGKRLKKNFPIFPAFLFNSAEALEPRMFAPEH